TPTVARLARRDFLKGASASALTFAAGATVAAPAPTEAAVETSAPPIIDTHQHLWDLARFRLPWLQGAPTLNKSFLMPDYLQATAGLGVVKSVYMEVDVDPSQHVAEAE